MALLDRNVDFRAEVVRNITSLRRAVNLFDDLVPDDPEAQACANAAEMAVRPEPPGVVARGFAYSQAVEYPFRADRAMASRYGDGRVRVWYGALDEDTATAESAWHALQQLRAIEGVSEVVVRERAVYRVQAAGLFIDVRGKLDEAPQLVADDYGFTQALGRRLSGEGHPGLLYPAARWNGDCLAAFTPRVLAEARLAHYLSYRIDPVAGMVRVERRPGRVERTLHEAQLRRSI